MNTRSSEELSLPYKRTLIVAALVLIAIVAILAIVDRIRLDQRRTELKEEFCAIVIPEAQLRMIDALAESVTRGDLAADTLNRTFDAIVPHGTVDLFFESGDTVWLASGWGGAKLTGRLQLPSGYRTWAELADVGCVGTLEGRRVKVIRSFRTIAGRRAVLVMRADTDRDPD